MEKLKTERAKRTVYLPAAVDAWLAEHAKARGMTASAWLVGAINEVRGERLLSDGVADRLRKGGR